MKKLLCLIAFVALASSSLAQGRGTGAYAFSSFDNKGFDSINLGNLNTRFSIPILNRQGRGMGFNYAIKYEGLIWQPVTSLGVTTWVPSPSWGFDGALNGATFSGYLTYISATLGCPGGNGGLPHMTSTSNYVYHDPYGANHNFDYATTSACPTIGPTPGRPATTTGNGSSNDGSGYSLLNGSRVETRTGAIIVPATSPNGKFNTSVTDAHGNTISSTASGTFVDTLGVTALTVAGSNPVTLTYPVTLQSNNVTSASATINFSTYTVRTKFQCSGISEYGSLSASLISSITLANGSSYSFTYEPTPGATDGAVTGRLASITLPTGGTIGYAYTGGCDGSGINADGTTSGLTRTTTDGVKTYSRSTVNTNATTTTVQDEKNNVSIYQFSRTGAPSQFFYETHRQIYQGTTTSGGTLLEKYTCYNGAAASCDGQAITLPMTQVGVTTSYNNGFQDVATSTYDSVGLLTGSTETFGGSTLESTAITYNSFGEVLSSTTTDGSGNTVASTTNGYDETTPTATSGIPQHTIPSGATGNLTSTHVSTGSSTLSTSTTYYDTGVPVATTTPNGQTQYSYDSTQAFVTGTTLPTPSSGVSLSTSASYDQQSTAPLSVTGMNSGQTTQVTQYDQVLRFISVTLANVGQITYTYYSPNETEVSQTMGNGSSAATFTLLDAYGRISRTAVYNGQTTNNYYQVDYCYDATGLLQFQSVRYQATGFTTAPQACSTTGANGTSYVYDALGRLTSSTNADGSSSSQYSGRAVEKTDVNGVQRISQYDALGRMSGVCEISSNANMPNSGSPASCGMDIAGTGFLTSYSYNLANHQTTITQGSQTRIVQTDAAGRTTSVTEPERGTTTYSYTYNTVGLVVTRIRPQANQTNASVLTTTTTQYDSLGRVVSVSYNDGLTPAKNYYYDVAVSGQQWSQTPANTKGLLVGTTSGSGSSLTRSLYSYDLMGNVTSMWQCAPSICGTAAQSSRPSLSFSYDLVNNLTNESDGASGSITYGRSPAGEVTSIVNNSYAINGSGASSPANLVTNIANGPFGPNTYTLGNGLNIIRTYDSMGRNNAGWVCTGSATPDCNTQLYGFAETISGSRVISSCDTVLNQCQSNGYDEFNRLTSVSGPNSQSLIYDRYGNRAQETSSPSGSNQSYLFNTATNQNSGMTYDAAGNVTSDAAHTYTYDAEGNVIQVDGGNTATYVYDALNNRVQAPTSTGIAEFLYDPFGRRISSWLVASNAGDEGKIYWDNKQIAFRDIDGLTYFDHSDWLGTERVRTNYQGAYVLTDYTQAYGDGFSQYVSDSYSNQDTLQFAGTDYDTESNTNHAQFRQYSSTQGRWMSPILMMGAIAREIHRALIATRMP